MRKMVFLLVLLVVMSLGICGCFQVDNILNEEEKVNNTPLDENTFTESQQDLIELSKYMYIVHINIDNDLSDVDKARFFTFIISSNFYKDKCEIWKNEDQYIIPLSDIENIIFTHLNTSDFNPTIGFQEMSGSRIYDKNKEAYIADDIGGYGGAAALGVLQCSENGNEVNIVLGSYEMNQYFSDAPTYELIETYEVDFLMADRPNNFKILRAEFCEKN